ncbi:MAG: MBOAT family protein [Proteobacteria bacterium]|nr:MBOAT family protein [Pseudomonadota bacterium]
MLFNSHIFIFIFLPITLIGFYWIGGRGHHRVALSWLVATSLFFYSWWNPAYLVLFLFSILFNYAVGVNLSQMQDKNGMYKAKFILVAGIAVNLGLIGYFKYANFFVNSVNDLSNSNWHLDTIILPLAISFYTFQQVAYLVDAYRGLTREYNFLHYCLFVTFFPQLIAGPIVHHREMLPQFAQEKVYRLETVNLAVGMTIFFVGLFKKVVIADNIAEYATPVFMAADAGEQLTFLLAWTGTFAYTLQLYFDFSGYSDMAIGLARMFGIILPMNFNSPYQATNIIDFWRRWHITLSRFLRDYLYFPLGGNRQGLVRRHLNLLLTMLLGGLWHGAGWTYVVWGGLHGVYLIINHLWRGLCPWSLKYWWSTAFSRLLTLLVVMISWVFFRAETFEGALNMLSAMGNFPSTFHGILGPLETLLAYIGIRFEGGFLSWEHYKSFGWFAFWLGVVWFWPNTQQLMSRYDPVLQDHVASDQKPLLPWVRHIKWHLSIFWAVIMSVVAALTFLSLNQMSEFLYFQF